eukprot:CAMPEP_0172496676 /NCGR_PEP_ID=MMETSP1066-20121228/91215_1 /TAXON_ID=671091 /ORGANISM="Coscinodiscus wailesii, Strain CCMP2513" /LENGTH=246 /DNA_ID=CAMNT_0013269089 /DNA_START=83 /DNA_END=823 /DNA_ORIENTATION=+
MSICLFFLLATTATAFQTVAINRAIHESPALLASTAATEAESSPTSKSGYVPKWKKKQTLADEMSDIVDFEKKGIKGTISVKFQQGNETKQTMAMPGQPLRDVATQAGQFIKYGCGKGECGTCEAQCNGKWIRPCTAVVPVQDEEVVIIVKEIKSATTSSGTFFSVKSFFMGFYNNVLGMVGFVKYRQNAKKNWEERQEYEALIERLTLEKRQKRRLEWNQRKAQESVIRSAVSAPTTAQNITLAP